MVSWQVQVWVKEAGKDGGKDGDMGNEFIYFQNSLIVYVLFMEFYILTQGLWLLNSHLKHIINSIIWAVQKQEATFIKCWYPWHSLWESIFLIYHRPPLQLQ